MTHSDSKGQYCPYLVVAVFPPNLPHVIGRHYNRADADAEIRFLKRRVSKGSYFLAYEPASASSSEQEKES
ncbi:MAG: hypothetical protein AAF327_25390 [Cyanobacteria bacterium P01_A01_bin.37]